MEFPATTPSPAVLPSAAQDVQVPRSAGMRESGLENKEGWRLTSSVGLLHLLHLASPALPVGAYSYSQGLEYAVEAQWVRDETSALDWIAGLLSHTLAHLDVPVAARLYHAWQHDDVDAVTRWSQFLLANREARELQDEDRNMGLSLARLLNDLGMTDAAAWCKADYACFLTLFTLAAQRWQIALPDALHGYLWSWAENQVLSAVKLIPLGQTAGQRLLRTLQRIYLPLICRDARGALSFEHAVG